MYHVCRDCGGAWKLDDDGRCSFCATVALGEVPIYTVSAEEWSEYDDQEKKLARSKGICPRGFFWE